MANRNKKLSQEQLRRKQRGEKYLHISIVLSLILTALVLIDITSWLTVKEENSLGLVTFVFLIPLYMVLFAVAAGFCLKGASIAPGRKANLATYAVIIPLVLFLGVLPVVKSAVYRKWDCQEAKLAGTTCQQQDKELAQELKDEADITYAHTHIKAYMPSHHLPGYKNINPPINSKTSINVYYSTPVESGICRDTSGDCGYSFLAMNDLSLLTNQPAAATTSDIGKTAWGSVISMQTFDGGAHSWGAQYTTQLDGTYLIILVGRGTLGAMSNHEVAAIFNSVQRVN